MLCGGGRPAAGAQGEMETEDGRAPGGRRRGEMETEDGRVPGGWRAGMRKGGGEFTNECFSSKIAGKCRLTHELDAFALWGAAIDG